MSRTVYYKGKLSKVDNPEKKSPHELALTLLSEDNKSVLEKWYDGDAIECLQEVNERTYFFDGSTLFLIDIEEDEPTPKDIFMARELQDGQIEFEVQYYDGGCGFLEAIEEAVTRNITKKST